MIATYLENPDQGEVSRRTAFIRNNGRTEDGTPSFTAIFSRCVHLGCPVQPNGPIDEEATKEVNGSSCAPFSPRASAARATAGCTTPKEIAAPAHRSARSTGSSSRSGTAI